MANDLDQFPLQDKIIDQDHSGYLSGVWNDFFATFFQNLIGYLTQNGIIVPNLTQAQINAIQTPQAGQMVYNTTTSAPQIYQAGAWKTFTTS